MSAATSTRSPRRPPRGYRVEVIEDGERVTTIPFTVGEAEVPPDLEFGSPDCIVEEAPRGIQ